MIENPSTPEACLKIQGHGLTLTSHLCLLLKRAEATKTELQTRKGSWAVHNSNHSNNSNNNSNASAHRALTQGPCPLLGFRSWFSQQSREAGPIITPTF